MNRAAHLRAEQAMDQVRFLGKKFEIFYFVRDRARSKPSLVIRLITVCSKFKFMFSAGIQVFGLKTTSHGKSDLKTHILRSDLPCEVVFRPRSFIPSENMNLNLLQTVIVVFRPKS